MNESPHQRSSALFNSLACRAEAVEELRHALRSPVHAYLFIGPPGSGKGSAAAAFAASLLCGLGGCGQCKSCRMAALQSHPDLFVIERNAAALGLGEIREATRLAARSPQESARQVIIIKDLHTAPLAIPALLKTVEEPPDTTVFVLLSERLGSGIETLASRCALIHFARLSDQAIAKILEKNGAGEETAAEIAAASNGDLNRARMLLDDPGFAARQDVWRSVSARLDGTGATIVAIVEELLASVELSVGPIKKIHSRENTAVEKPVVGSKLPKGARVKESSESSKEREDRHRRDQRRVRTQELKNGLAVLASSFAHPFLSELRSLDPQGNAKLFSQENVQLKDATRAVELIDAAAASLIRNPNEALLLQVLLFQLASAQDSPNMARVPG